MADRRGEGNVIKRAAQTASEYDPLGVKSRADSFANSVGKASSATSNAVGKKVIDPLLGDVVQTTYSQIVTKPLQKYRSFTPAFARESQRLISYNKIAPAGRGAESGERPTRMFNIYTGNLEMGWENPNAQYAIFSHGWKGSEIEFLDIEKVRAKAVERDPYNPSQLRYKYLSDGITSDVQRLVAYYEREVAELFHDGWKGEKLRTVKCGGVHVNEQPCGNNQCDWDQTHIPAATHYMKVVDLTSDQRTVLEKRRSAYKIMASLEATRNIVEHPDNQKLGEARLKAGYLWNDTCCINKTVTSEHITTLALMGEWYSNAEFCVGQLDSNPRDEDWVYDVRGGVYRPFTFSGLRQNYTSLQDVAEQSRIRMPYWSMRGWTLQELCLSKKIVFFNNRWEALHYRPISTKQGSTEALGEKVSDFPTFSDSLEDDGNTRNVIAEFTGIPTEEVCRGSKPSELSAYDILAYARQRQCTVEVDRVYSLMGMLHVKFAAFHAEGLTMALTRLLDSVVSTTHDVSIFNWAGERWGSTIPGRSLYPVNFNSFVSEIAATRSRIYEGEAYPGHLKAQPQGTAPPEGQKEDKELSDDDIELEGVAVFQSLHDIDRHLELTSHSVSNTVYEAIPEKSLTAIIEYVKNTDFGSLGKEGYMVVQGLFKVLREIDNRYQVPLAEAAAKAAEEQQLKERLLREQELQLKQAEEAANAPPTPPVDESPIKPAKSERSFGSSMRLKGTKALFGASKKSPIEATERPEPRPARTSWLASALGGNSNPTPAATPNQTPDGTSTDGPKSSGVEDWCALIERIVKFLGAHKEEISELGNKGPELNTGVHHVQTLRSKLVWISELLDAIAQSPGENASALEHFESHLNQAPYFRHMLAHRALSFIIGLQASPDKPVAKPWELKKLLSFLKKTIPGNLSQAIIDKLNTVLYNTPYDKCPDMSSIESLVVTTTGWKKGSGRIKNRVKGQKATIHKPSMISRNPIIVSTSGIEGLFDIQRVVVDVKWIREIGEVEGLPRGTDPRPQHIYDPRSLVERAIRHNKPDQVYIGQCRISTGISSTIVNFSCTAQVLQKQLDLRAVLAQTDLKPPNPEKSNRLDYITILNFVREVDIELVAGEWVLARFAGVDRADWFLCLLEIGATHPFYGWRIPTSKVDFSMTGAEPDLVEWWEKYMGEKKALWCELIRKRLIKRKAESESKVAKAERKKNAEAVSIQNLRMDTLKALQGGESVVSLASDRITKYAAGEILHVHGKMDRRMMEKEDYVDKKELRFKALEAAEVPPEAHAAVLSLDENSVLPTMFFAAKRIHMF